MNKLTKEVVFQKRVLMRVDFNVEINQKGEVVDDYRIKRVLPTIKFLKKSGALKIILISHLGQPTPNTKNTNEKKEFSLKPIAHYLSKTLREKVYFIPDKINSSLRKKIDKLPLGSLILLENIRFYSGEENNSLKFAQRLAQLGDVYINEAFAVSHRKNSSVCAITKFLPSYAGLLFTEEIQQLSDFLTFSHKPIVTILGGAKIKDKLPLINNFSKQVDYILIGGGLANTLLKSIGFTIGQSLYESEMLKEARRLKFTNCKLILPVDFCVADKDNKVRHRAVNEVKESDKILDIGLQTQKKFLKIIAKARMIFWNGPLGKIEDARFQKGTKQIILALSKNKDAKVLIGGGDTLKSFKLLKIRLSNFDTEKVFFSTGGGAMLNYLAGEKLPGLEALNKKSKF
jgi:phosphoglycerate kinase